MAPEQLRGEPADRMTDAYGAGATAFDLRYGRSPFRDVTAAMDELAAPAFPQPRSPAEAYFQHLLRGMLAKRKEDRPQDLCEPATHFATLSAALRPWREHDALAVLGKNQFRFLDCEISLRAGDIADEDVDGIVSSANYEMTMRAGVGEALRKRGGDGIEQEAMKDGPHTLGECVPTAGGTLRAAHVLHAVSAWSGTSCVGRATERALSVADRLGLRTLAFPALGTGMAHVSIETSANAMVTALRWRLALGGSRLQKVTMVLGDEAKLAALRDVAVEALRGTAEPPRVVDLGLPDDLAAVTPEGATFIDAASHGAAGKT
jgi:O-acetyl-ADP-ribose deacetylase (regulator of RNase III)